MTSGKDLSMQQRELKRILLVEDEPDIRKIARIALKNIGGFEVEVSDSGHEALKMIQACQPDLAILDVMMPGMDGPTTLQKIRKIEGFAELPVMFMTAKVQPHEINEYMALGILGVISKPFDPVTLPQEVKDIWNALELAKNHIKSYGYILRPT